MSYFNQNKLPKRTPAEQIQAYVSKIKVLYQNAYLKTVAGKVPPRAAIKMKCLDCCCYERNGVIECDIVTCPLFPWKPKYSQRTSEPEGSDKE